MHCAVELHQPQLRSVPWIVHCSHDAYRLQFAPKSGAGAGGIVGTGGGEGVNVAFVHVAVGPKTNEEQFVELQSTHWPPCESQPHWRSA
jgi:hypothetical protein